MNTSLRLIALALAAGAAGATGAAASQPTGVWIDHTGRGAVEIAECTGGNGLCGHVVWVKDGKNKSACRTQIIGNAKPVGANTWDRGWIVDPDDNARYSVELKPMGEDRLRVTGYMGSKLFSETMIWKRAPAELQRCDNKQAAAPSSPAAAPTSVPASTPSPAGPSAALPPAPAPRPAQRPAESSPFEPVSPPPAPQREAAAPIAPTPPAATPAPAPAAPAVQPGDGPQTAESVPEEQPKPRRGSNGKRKTASNECRLELPYVTLKYPCDAF